MNEYAKQSTNATQNAERTTDRVPVDGDAESSLDDVSIAVAHEHYRYPGGGEHVAEHIAELFDAPIYAGIIRDGTLPDKDIEFHEVFSGVKKRLMDRSTFVRDFLYFLGWQYRPELREYDVIIQSGNNPGWYVPEDDQVVVRYTHSTPRTAFDRFQEKGASRVVRTYGTVSRVLYQSNVTFPDRYVANSELVRYRLEKYWGIDDAPVVYPPVPVEDFEPAPKGEFYLTYSRLMPNKRFEEMIDAFKRMPDRRLVVGGDGALRPDLEARAAGFDNIEFLGYMSESEKRDRVGRAKALVYAARNEDFGMVPVEAMAGGTPVIGVDEGYTRFQVDDGRTGVLYDRGVEGLVDAVERFEREGVTAGPDEIAAEAAEYSVANFRRRLRRLVAKTVAEAPTLR